MKTLLTLLLTASFAFAYDPTSDLNGKDEETVEVAAVTDAWAFKQSGSGEPVVVVAKRDARNHHLTSGSAAYQWYTRQFWASTVGDPTFSPFGN